MYTNIVTHHPIGEHNTMMPSHLPGSENHSYQKSDSKAWNKVREAD
jgi:hypothetical protein